MCSLAETRRLEGRLLVDGPGPGAWNMAVDEMLLEEAVAGRPTLRFYQWQEPTLSLGYFQPYAERRDHPPSATATAVRRQTGGGALLHDRELTYSLGLPAASPFARAHLSLYDVVHEAVRQALGTWSINARLYRDLPGSDASRPGPLPFLCFLRRNAVDLVVPSADSPAGIKVLGSAQRRRRGAILQHGAILLDRSTSAPELAGLVTATGVAIDPEKLAEQLAALLQDLLDVSWIAEDLQDSQRQRAEQLCQEKYETAAWRQRR